MAPPLVPVAVLGIGAYLAWFGVHYWDSSTKWPTDPVKAVLTGKPIPQPTGKASASAVASAIEQTNPTAAGTAAGQGIANASTGSAIANDALKYEGDGYVYGGPSEPGKWDCSSFVNYVIGHDLNMPIPGGTWAVVCDNGASHGPATPSWMLFGQPINYGSEKPGDLLVTVEHMGIVIGGGGMISAQDPALGTGISAYGSGFPGGQPVVRRVSSG